MNLRCGTDIALISRIAGALARNGEAFLSKVFTEAEVAYCRKRDGQAYHASLAARFAAKEAVAKALGTGIGPRGVSFKDIEVRTDRQGAPFVLLYNRTKELYEEMGGASVAVSLSHDGDQAVAFCVMCFEDGGLSILQDSEG